MGPTTSMIEAPYSQVLNSTHTRKRNQFNFETAYGFVQLPCTQIPIGIPVVLFAKRFLSKSH